MSVLIEMCFIQVVGGYVNVAQITSVSNKAVCTTQTGSCTETGDKSAEDFINRVVRTCGGRSK